MRTFKRILFPVEFSPECELAAVHVTAWAKRFNAEVVMLHAELPPAVAMEGMVWEPPRTEEMVEKLRGFLVDEFRDVVVHRVFRWGEPASEIIRYVRNEGADLIMMPTHGRGPFRRFLIGSVTAKVLHDAPCPVWTAAHLEDSERPIAPEIKNLLCAVDLDDRGVHTLRYAAGFTKMTNSRLTVAHAVPYSVAAPTVYTGCDIRVELMNAARERIAVMQQEADTNGVPCIGTGSITEFISHAAKQHQADLVLIGRGSHGLLGRLRTHDYAIIRECGCPVLSL